jgi:hypothetical protein
MDTTFLSLIEQSRRHKRPDKPLAIPRPAPSPRGKCGALQGTNPKRARLLDLYCQRAARGSCLWTGQLLPPRYRLADRLRVARALAVAGEALTVLEIRRLVVIDSEALSWLLLSDWFDFQERIRVYAGHREGLTIGGLYRLSATGRASVAAADAAEVEDGEEREAS